MINFTDKVSILAALGNILSNPDKVSTIEENVESLDEVSQKAYQKNNWFTKENVMTAAKVWGQTLSEKNILKWLEPYEKKLKQERIIKKVGVINAGNIPFVGLHDLITVFLSGNEYVGKNASEDPYLLSYITRIITETDKRTIPYFHFTERLQNPDAVIATGSNNSARYFEYYFGKYPHVIRKNRNGIAVLQGNESVEDLKSLGIDIFSYFGLGCRNVSKLYVPSGYDFKEFFEAIFSFSGVLQHNKYMNNFEYHKAVFLLKRIPFLQNGFLILREEKVIPSPVAVVHYEYYNDLQQLTDHLDGIESEVQCVATNSNLDFKTSLQGRSVKFGETQKPTLMDYADGVDTLDFLLNI